MTDVLIAGGGIAGSALAILLGRMGLAVELYEREEFPREKPCGEGLMPGGVAVLERLGIADLARGALFFGVRYHFGQVVAEGRFPKVAGFPAVGCGQRRKILDEALFRAAAGTPGVAAHTGTQVEGLLRTSGRVVGATVDGRPRRAALVVAADGVHSRLRRLAGLDAPSRRKRFGVRIHLRLADGQVQPPWVEIFIGRGHELYVTPLPNREVLVAGLADARSFSEPIANALARWWQAEPALARRFEGAQQITPLLASSPLAGRALAGVAPGIVLLGDAAGFLDPITGGGMTQALMAAELLAQSISRGLAAGSRSQARNAWLASDAWLSRFDRERRAMLRDYRLVTHVVLWLADHPRLAARALLSIRHSPSFFSHLIAVSSGVRGLFGGVARLPAYTPGAVAATGKPASSEIADAVLPEAGQHRMPVEPADEAHG
jgi:flavin-dependent dehydrogenase